MLGGRIPFHRILLPQIAAAWSASLRSRSLWAARCSGVMSLVSINWLFAGSDAGGTRAAAIASLIATSRLNGLDPQVYLRHVLGCIAKHPVKHVAELFPWNCANSIAAAPEERLAAQKRRQSPSRRPEPDAYPEPRGTKHPWITSLDLQPFRLSDMPHTSLTFSDRGYQMPEFSKSGAWAAMM